MAAAHQEAAAAQRAAQVDLARPRRRAVWAAAVAVIALVVLAL